MPIGSMWFNNYFTGECAVSLSSVVETLYRALIKVPLAFFRFQFSLERGQKGQD